jgi:hypothetical protein
MTDFSQKAEQSGAIRTAVVFAVVIILAQTIAISEEMGHPIYSAGEGHLLALRLSHVALALVVLAVVLTCGQRLKSPLLRSIPLLLVAPAFPLSWLAHTAYSRAHVAYSPLLGYKLICLLLSLAPGPAVLPNALVICGFSVEAVVLWYFGGVREAQLGTISGEPWATLLFACASLLILILQNAYRTLQRQLGEMTVRKHVIEDLSRLSMAIRDRINSPLQTLEICFELLPKNEVTTAGRKSLNAINDNVRAWREFDCLIDWEQEREFLPPDTLVKRLRKYLQEHKVAFQLRSPR